MKRAPTFRILVFVILGMICSMPFAVIAQQNLGVLEARGIAQQDAQSDVNKMTWFGVGGLFSAGTLLLFRIVDEPTPEMCGLTCLIHGVALAGTFLYAPTPDPSRLIGKPPEYIAAYTVAYKAEARKNQAVWGIVGYISGGLVMSGVLILEQGSNSDFYF